MKRVQIKLAILSLTLVTGFSLVSCTKNSPNTTPSTQTKSATVSKMTATAPVRVYLDGAQDDWDPLTKSCSLTGKGCWEYPITCLTPSFSNLFFATLDNGNPTGIKQLFNDKTYSDCLPSAMLSDKSFMTLVNAGQMYSKFYSIGADANTRVYLFGNTPDLTMDNYMLIAPIHNHN